MRMSANAIDILGGHEDAIHFNPAQHVLSNADYANSSNELIAVIREQHKEGADFVKIYETGPDRMIDGVLRTPYQYTEEQLAAAVAETRRLGTGVGVHAMGEPGTLYAAEAGVTSIDHATQLSDETMRLMKEKHIPAVPTFAIFEYFATHRESQDQAARRPNCSSTRLRNSESRSLSAFPSPSGPMWVRSHTARRHARWC